MIVLNLICTKPSIIYCLKYSDWFSKISKIYNKLGQFSCKTENPNNIKEYICIGFGYSYVYVGQLKAGTNRASGVGIKVWEDRDIQEGEWKNDSLNGYGRTIYENGDYYIGEFKDNKRQGYGEYYYGNGNVYKGNWLKSWIEGQGTMTYKDGTVKSGLWKNWIFKG